MIECETRLKTWGNSIGIVIPKKTIKKERLHSNQKVKVIITTAKTIKVKDIFGKIRLKRSTKDIMGA